MVLSTYKYESICPNLMEIYFVLFWFTSLLILSKMSDWAKRSFINSETIDTNSHVTNIDL